MPRLLTLPPALRKSPPFRDMASRLFAETTDRHFRRSTPPSVLSFRLQSLQYPYKVVFSPLPRQVRASLTPSPSSARLWLPTPNKPLRNPAPNGSPLSCTFPGDFVTRLRTHTSLIPSILDVAGMLLKQPIGKETRKMAGQPLGKRAIQVLAEDTPPTG